jgi:DNA-binding Xre family transcriptional regulator
MTQAELAARTAISLPHIRRLDRGEIDNPPLRYLVNCAWVLDCRLQDLIEDEWFDWLDLTSRGRWAKPGPHSSKPASIVRPAPWRHDPRRGTS